jgi:hypothetical protein
MGRKVFLALSFLLVAFCQSAPAQNTDKLREVFFTSDTELEVAVFASVSAKQNLSIPLNLAYSGVAIAMQAEYASGPWNKLKLFNEGKKAIEQAIDYDPGNPEIRFLRFSIQSNIPSLLMYSGDLENDLKAIEQYIKHSPNIETAFWNKALNVMLLAENVSDAQRIKIRSLVSYLS